MSPQKQHGNRILGMSCWHSHICHGRVFPARRDILEKSSVLFEKWYSISHSCQYITKLLGPVLLFADGVSTLVWAIIQEI